MLYYTCPDCGANLDPGERCDCRSKKVQERSEKNRYKQHRYMHYGRVLQAAGAMRK